jgi:hypothetical protein
MLKIWSTLTVLQHQFPLEHKVTVLIEALPDEEQGEWSYAEEQGHIIKVDARLKEEARDEVLVHEYAHAICSYLPAELADTAWGLVYGQLYNTVFGDHS